MVRLTKAYIQRMLIPGLTLFDIPEVQFGFQDPASPTMEGIIDLHHDICFFLLIILVFVSYLLLVTYWFSMSDRVFNWSILADNKSSLFYNNILF